MPSVRATLSPTKVRRGQVMKLVVKALANDVVITAIQYRHARAKLAKGKPDAHGVFAKAWRIAKNAPLGSGSLKVTVMDGSATEYEDTLAFSVTK